MKRKDRYNLKKMTIFFSILLTLFTFLVIIVILTLQIGKQIEGKQKENFESHIKDIKVGLSKKDMTEVLDEYTQQGYSIIVFDQSDNIVYPEAADKTNLLLNPNGLVSSFSFNDQRVVVSYPMSINSEDATTAYLRILPIIIIVLMVVVFLILRLYLNVLKKEMDKIKALILDIKQNKASNITNLSHYNIKISEFSDMAGQLKEMYQENQLKEQALNSEINKVNKLQANSVSLFNSIAHEMKTPLMSSRLLMERIEYDDLNTNNRELLGDLSGELVFLENFTKEMLFVAQRKNQSVSFFENSVCEAITKIEKNYHVLLNEKHIVMNISVKEDFLMNLDKLLIEKVLSNLISNAIYYSADYSTVDIDITSCSITITNPLDSTLKQEDTFTDNHTGIGLFLIEMMLLESDYHHTITKTDDCYTVMISINEEDSKSHDAD